MIYDQTTIQHDIIRRIQITARILKSQRENVKFVSLRLGTRCFQFNLQKSSLSSDDWWYGVNNEKPRLCSGLMWSAQEVGEHKKTVGENTRRSCSGENKSNSKLASTLDDRLPVRVIEVKSKVWSFVRMFRMLIQAEWCYCIKNDEIPGENNMLSSNLTRSTLLWFHVSLFT